MPLDYLDSRNIAKCFISDASSGFHSSTSIFAKFLFEQMKS